jgi:hypothetical protein
MLLVRNFRRVVASQQQKKVISKVSTPSISYHHTTMRKPLTRNRVAINANAASKKTVRVHITSSTRDGKEDHDRFRAFFEQRGPS